MPKVGNKKFGYGSKGMKAAREESKRTGKPMKMGKTTGYTYGNPGMAGKTSGIQGQTCYHNKRK